MNSFLIIGIIAIVIFAIILVSVGYRVKNGDPMQSHLGEFSSRDEPIELNDLHKRMPGDSSTDAPPPAANMKKRKGK